MMQIPHNVMSQINRERRAAIFLHGLAQVCHQAGESSLCAAMVRDRDHRNQRAIDLIDAMIPVRIPPTPSYAETLIDITDPR